MRSSLFKLGMVSHCWNYSRLLCWQLSSLYLYPPREISVEAIIFFCPDDRRTVAVLEWFARHAVASGLNSLVKLHPWPLDQRKLCRRAIGRNLAFKASRADWVWATDVDYLFGPDCLDAIPSAMAAIAGPLAFPRFTNRTATQEIGDELIERVTEPGLYTLPVDDSGKGDPAAGLWEVERNHRAIGGIQIVNGDVARREGYLPDSRRFQRPADRWMRTFEDRAYRAAIGAGRGEAIDLPNLYRLRHGKRGRFDVGVQL